MSSRKLFFLLIFFCMSTCVFTNSYAETEIGSKHEVTLDKKIDTSKLSGVNLWIAKLYNDDRILYAVVVVLVMAVLGSIIAYGTDLILRLFGINVGRISHRE